MEPACGEENIVSYITEQTIGELRDYYHGKLPKEMNSLPEDCH